MKNGELETHKMWPYGVYWQDIFNTDEIKKIHELAKSYKTEEGRTGFSGVKQDPKIRSSDVKWLGYNEKSEWMYERICNTAKQINREIYNFDLSGCEPIQYSIYTASKQGHYDWHQDLSVTDQDNNQYRKLSSVILLSDNSEFSGGSFLVKNGHSEDEILMKPGRMIIFPSWLLHTARPVLEGVRTTLVTWFHGNNFR